VNGHGSIDCAGEAVRDVRIKVLGGPLKVTKFVVHFADKKIPALTQPTGVRTVAEWTSGPSKWAGSPRKIASVEYWYSGMPGTLNTRMQILGTR